MGEGVGEHYQKQSLVNIRSVINRHLQLPPFNRTWDLVKDSDFQQANRVFSGNLITQKEKGWIHHRCIDPSPKIT